MTSPSLEQVVFVRNTGRFHSVLFFPQFLGSHDFNSDSSFVTSSELGNCFESFQYRNHLWLQKDWGLEENCIIRAWHATMALSPYQRAAFSQPALNGLCLYPNLSWHLGPEPALPLDNNNTVASWILCCSGAQAPMPQDAGQAPTSSIGKKILPSVIVQCSVSCSFLQSPGEMQAVGKERRLGWHNRAPLVYFYCVTWKTFGAWRWCRHTERVQMTHSPFKKVLQPTCVPVAKRYHVPANKHPKIENTEKINLFAHEWDDTGMGQLGLCKWCL